LRLGSLGLIGQIGLPGRIERRQIAGQAGEGWHESRQVSLLQRLNQTFA
jgi:hypothetical protein